MNFQDLKFNIYSIAEIENIKLVSCLNQLILNMDPVWILMTRSSGRVL
jgi:hypothetical protein